MMYITIYPCIFISPVIFFHVVRFYSRIQDLVGTYILDFAEGLCTDIICKLGSDFRVFHGETRSELNENAVFKETIPTSSMSDHKAALQFSEKWSDIYKR